MDILWLVGPLLFASAIAILTLRRRDRALVEKNDWDKISDEIAQLRKKNKK